MKKIDRRQFIALTTATTGGIIAHQLWQRKDEIDISWANSSFDISQKVYKSENGLLEVDLKAGYTPVQIDDRTINLLTYNGQIPAPRLEAK